MRKTTLYKALILMLTTGFTISCQSSHDPSSIDSTIASSIIQSSILNPSTDQIDTSSTNGGGSGGDISTSDTPKKIIIHFQNTEKDYTNRTFWIWSDSFKPEVESEPTGRDDFGIYVEFDPTDLLKREDKSVWFLVKSTGDWSYQTRDLQLNFADYNIFDIDGVPTMHAYALAASKSDVMLCKSLEEIPTDYILSAKMNASGKQIEVVGTGANIESCQIYALDRSFYAYGMQSTDRYKYIAYRESGIGKPSFTVNMPASFKFSFDTIYEIQCIFETNETYRTYKSIDISSMYNSALFRTLVYEGDDLGLTFDNEGLPIFKVYAPTSPFVQLNLYKHGYPSSYAKTSIPDSEIADYDEPYRVVNLIREKTGVHTSVGATDYGWATGDIREQISNGEYYYTYTVYNSLGKNEVVDPYARTTSVNSLRALIVDMDDPKLTPTDYAALPLKWDGDTRLDIENPLDLVISENHIRDLTMDETWSDKPEDRKIAGTYEAFALEGTTYTSNGVTVKTGADHLEELGANAIQILPFYDQDNDETTDVYNWGYNPLNYNVPEGQYSSDPYDPYARVYELRNLVAHYANNDNNTRIIMDVVYNHVSKAFNSNFEFLAPDYYFRKDTDGSFLNNSGCGNEFKSENPMARKFIVDSVCFWASNYKIKGFRFDLMGLLDVQTMKEVKEALYEIDPDIVVYGEGWDATGTYSGDTNHATTAQAYAQLFPSTESPGFVGAFNDAGRDSLRGSNNGGNGYPGYGFISQGTSDLDRAKVAAVADMMKGNHTGKGGNPVQTINYASCHDNYTLFDQLNWTLSDDGGKTEPALQTVAQASVAVNGLILMSNGMAFINGGEEIFRTKIETEADSPYAVNMYGKLISHNSYTSSDETNSYKYDRKVELLEYFNMYKDLINIRKNLKYIPYPENNDSSIIDTWDTTSGTTLSVFREGKDGHNYYFLFNGRSSNSTFNLGDAEQIFTNGPSFVRTNYTINVKSNYALACYKL